MATNYKKMSLKALNAMLNSAEVSEEEKTAIQAELIARNAAKEPEAAPAQESEAPEMTDEEKLAALERKAEEMRTFIHHKCTVLAVNIDANWHEGVIVGVSVNRKMNSAYFAIRLDNGKMVTKAQGSNLLKISDEVAEVAKASRTKAEKEAWTDEKLAALVAEHSANVGHIITKADGTTGRIVAIVADKRSQSILYKIFVSEPSPRTSFASVTSEGYTINPELDEEGAALNANYLARKERAAQKAAVTPEEKLANLKEMLKKAKSDREKLDKKIQDLEKSIEEANKAVNSAETAEEPTEPTEPAKSDDSTVA